MPGPPPGRPEGEGPRRVSGKRLLSCFCPSVLSSFVLVFVPGRSDSFDVDGNRLVFVLGGSWSPGPHP